MPKIIAVAVSTGGPKALQSIIPFLPAQLAAPIVVVQHMPRGFTASLADRLNSLSRVKVCEPDEGDVVENGCVYIARAGQHLNLVRKGKKVVVHYSDEPSREGVKPCANYMYESLAQCKYDEVICVVMTGMGADGTEGIRKLKESGQKAFVITQTGETCVVNGMPNACVKAGLSDEEVALTNISERLTQLVGVNDHGC